jgi:hypothetical protein
MQENFIHGNFFASIVDIPNIQQGSNVARVFAPCRPLLLASAAMWLFRSLQPKLESLDEAFF